MALIYEATFFFVFHCLALTVYYNLTVVSLALICSFNRMRKHLNLGDVKPAEVTQDTVKAVAQALRDSASLKVSEDGQFQAFFFFYFL